MPCHIRLQQMPLPLTIAINYCCYRILFRTLVFCHPALIHQNDIWFALLLHIFTFSHVHFHQSHARKGDRMRNVDIIWIIMCFCLPLTVISGSQCLDDYWAVPNERKREGETRRGGGRGGCGGLSHAERSLSISQQAYSVLTLPPLNPLLNEIHNKASSVCLVSSTIHAPCGKHSPFFNSLVAVSLFLFDCETQRLWRFAAPRDLLPHNRNVWKYLTAHFFVCACVIILSG